MRYLEPPNYLNLSEYTKSVFLAGSVGSKENWREDLGARITDESDLMIFSPYVKNFDNKKISEQELTEWENYHLNKASIVVFWFSWETFAPISLLELGLHINKNLVVGCDLDYLKRDNLEIQLSIHRPDLKIAYDLKDVLKEILRKTKSPLDISEF